MRVDTACGLRTCSLSPSRSPNRCSGSVHKPCTRVHRQPSRFNTSGAQHSTSSTDYSGHTAYHTRPPTLPLSAPYIISVLTPVPSPNAVHPHITENLVPCPLPYPHQVPPPSPPFRQSSPVPCTACNHVRAKALAQPSASAKRHSNYSL